MTKTRGERKASSVVGAPSISGRKSRSKTTEQLYKFEGEEVNRQAENPTATNDTLQITPVKRKADVQISSINKNNQSPRNLKRRKLVKAEEVEAEVADTSHTKATESKKIKGIEEDFTKGETTALKKSTKTRKTKVKEKAAVVEQDKETSNKVKRNRKIKSEEVEADEQEATEEAGGEALSKIKRQGKPKKETEEDGESPSKPKRRRKTKEEKEAEAMPLAARTSGLRMYIGAHVSAAGGVHNSVTNCIHIGGNAFAMFLKSQRKWENPPLQNENRDLFISSCGHHSYDASSHILPHGSYLVNLAQEEQEKATQAYNAFLNDLNRCEALGIKLYNFHPGWTGNHARPSAIARIAQALNRAHAATKTVIPVLEAMAGGGNVIGSTFEDLRDIIASVDDKERIGVCIDTCHVFAAGYDLRTPSAFKKTLDDFDKIVGMQYLRALHLNDSKAPFGSHRDLHQNIGLGFLGLRAFHNVMNEPRFEGLPMVLETPIDHKDPETGKDVEDKGVWAREIKMLEGLTGADAESEEFQAMEKELARKGEEERKKLQEQYDKKVEKERKALEKGQTKLQFGGKRKRKGSVGSDNDA